MLSISVEEFQTKLSAGEAIQLIDVREQFEHDQFNIGGELIPLADILQKISSIAIDKPVILYCEKGIRSQIAIQRLQQKFNFTNLYNLSGGIAKWRKMPGNKNSDAAI